MNGCAAERFCIINPFGIGDVLFSTPLLRSLHQAYPKSKIYYLCNKRAEPIIRNHPLLHKIFVYERDAFEAVKKKSYFLWLRAMNDFFNEIRREKIQVSFDLSLNSQYGFFAWYSGIKKRIGLDYKNRGRFLTHKIPIEGFLEKHVVEYYLDVLRLFNISVVSRELELFLSQDDRDFADGFWLWHHLTGKVVIGMIPCGGESFGNRAAMRRWPKENFAQLIRMLVDVFGVKIILLAGKKEEDEITGICKLAARDNAVIKATDTSITQLASLVAKSAFIISNDTGPLHIANALGKDIITFFGPVSEKVYGLYPLKPNHRVLTNDLPCRPCYRKFKVAECSSQFQCLQGISVESVFSAVRSLWEKNCGRYRENAGF